MSTDNPFFHSKVECPICKTLNEFETVRVGAYVEKGRDTDFCPESIEWRFPKYQAYNPLVYFVATCSNCFYSREFTNKFKEWKSDNNFRTYKLKATKDKHLDQLSTADSVIKRIGDVMNVSSYPNESAVLKLHLAIFDEKLFDHASKLDIGRFYLRIGWVFRSMVQDGSQPESGIQSVLTDLDSKYSMMKGAVQQSVDSIMSFEEYIKANFSSDDNTNEINSKLEPFKDKFTEICGDMTDNFNSTRENFANLDQILQDCHDSALGNQDPDQVSQFMNYPSFGHFLSELKKDWDSIVTNEYEALVKACEYYKAAFNDGRSIAPGNQQIQATYLIAELSRRVGNYETAKEYFNSTIKNGQEYIYRNRSDKTKTALAKKILELAIEQGKSNMNALKAK
jgi:uncharacterized protein (DUF2225 family)